MTTHCRSRRCCNCFLRGPQVRQGEGRVLPSDQCWCGESVGVDVENQAGQGAGTGTEREP